MREREREFTMNFKSSPFRAGQGNWLDKMASAPSSSLGVGAGLSALAHGVAYQALPQHPVMAVWQSAASGVGGGGQAITSAMAGLAAAGVTVTDAGLVIEELITAPLSDEETEILRGLCDVAVATLFTAESVAVADAEPAIGSVAELVLKIGTAGALRMLAAVPTLYQLVDTAAEAGAPDEALKLLVDVWGGTQAVLFRDALREVSRQSAVAAGVAPESLPVEGVGIPPKIFPALLMISFKMTVALLIAGRLERLWPVPKVPAYLAGSGSGWLSGAVERWVGEVGPLW